MRAPARIRSDLPLERFDLRIGFLDFLLGCQVTVLGSTKKAATFAHQLVAIHVTTKFAHKAATDLLFFLEHAA